MNPLVRWLQADRRLHLQHGPIDLIIEVAGNDSDDSMSAVRTVFQFAIDRFETVLTELVEELPTLRTLTCTSHCNVNGIIAKRMWQSAVSCEHAITVHTSDTGAQSQIAFSKGRTTPMIAVAGSVADDVLAAMLSDTSIANQLHSVSVNNGGDVALYLSNSARYRVGVVANPEQVRINGAVELTQSDGVGGIATSGWRGRSYSLGIADSVTVLAASASIADAAATLIANSVRLDVTGSCQYADKEFVERLPACELDPDSDLGDTPVTTHVRPLTQRLIDRALDNGHALAASLTQQNIIAGACLFLQDNNRSTGHVYQTLDRVSAGQPCEPGLTSRTQYIRHSKQTQRDISAGDLADA